MRAVNIIKDFNRNYHNSSNYNIIKFNLQPKSYSTKTPIKNSQFGNRNPTQKFSQFCITNTTHFALQSQPFQYYSHKRFNTNDATTQTTIEVNNTLNSEEQLVEAVENSPSSIETTTTTTTTIPPETTEQIINQVAGASTLNSEDLSTDRLTEIIDSFKEGPTQTVVDESTGYWFDPIIHSCESIIISIHNFTGFPWWASLITCGVLMRVATFPFNLISIRNSSKLAAIKETLNQIQVKRGKVRPGATAKERAEKAIELRKEIKEVSKAHGVSNWKIFLPAFAQIPIMICFYTAIRRMCVDTPEFMEGGALWFSNLTIPDPFFIFPVLTGSIFLGTTEIQRWINKINGVELNKISELIQKVFRVVFVVMIPLTSLISVGIHFYWIGTGTIGALMPLIWRSKYIQKVFDLPSNAGLQSVPKILPKPEATEVKPRTWKDK